MTEKVLFGTEQGIRSRNTVFFHFLDAFTLANRPLGTLKKLNYSLLPGSRLKIYIPRNLPEKYNLFRTKSFSRVCNATVQNRECFTDLWTG